MEVDLQCVLASAKVLLHINAPTAEHIVCRENLLVVEVDIGVGIQALQYKLDALFVEDVGIGGEGGDILPVLLIYPLNSALVKTEEWVFDNLVCHQVGMHNSWYGSVVPVCATRLLELPTVVQGLA